MKINGIIRYLDKNKGIRTPTRIENSFINLLIMKFCTNVTLTLRKLFQIYFNKPTLVCVKRHNLIRKVGSIE